jgi:hypothetical protein
MEKHEQELRRVASENLAMMAIICEFMARFARSHPACKELVREGFDCAIEHLQPSLCRGRAWALACLYSLFLIVQRRDG